MSTARSTPSPRRAQAGILLGYIGVAALALLLAGAVTQSLAAPFLIAAAVVACVGIGAWIAFAPGDFRATLTGRGARFGTISILGTILLAGVVLLTYLILARGAVTFDMTENQRFSLSPETRQILQRVRRPIQLTGFYTARNVAQREIDDQFFRLYEVETDGLIMRAYYDPNEQPAIAQRYGVIQDGQVFISFVDEDGGIDFNTLARVPRTASQERDVTGAISRLLVAGQIRVYFNVGLGERDPMSSAPDGISGIHNGVQESGIITAPLDIAALAEAGLDIPEDAAAVVMARPLRDLTQPEIDVIDRYLNTGGALFIMADVLFTEDAFLAEDGAFNAYLWETFGIRAFDAVIVDPAAHDVDSELNIISAVVFSETDISSRLDPASGLGTMFRLARPVDVNLTSAPPNIANGRLVMSSTASYGERDLARLGDTNTYAYDEGIDMSGPLTSVVWAYNQQTNARIVLVGDSDFASNADVSKAGNGVLFTDAMSWLSGFGEQVGFAPQAYITGLPFIFVSQQQLDLATFITVFLMPATLIVVGLAVRYRRMRQ
jgi:ABC-type uncharacterized transport system involved in gliding motility auxiliary subunit